MLVAAEVVVVTGPQLRLRVVVLTPADLAKVNVWPAVGVMAMEPPVVEIVEVKPMPSGRVMVRSLAPPPELMVIAEAPEASMEAALPRNWSDGVLIVRAAPEEMDSIMPAARVIEALPA